jgi:hypothetical protein
MSPKLAALAAWLTVTAFFGIIGGYQIVPQLVYLYDLSKSNRVTLGEVIEVHPEMHNRCEYRFSWDGRVYEHAADRAAIIASGSKSSFIFRQMSPVNPSMVIRWHYFGMT